MSVLIKDLPFYSVLDDGEIDCALWQSGANICDLRNDGRGTCDPSGFYYGTTDIRESRFCARHFYMEIVSGDGTTNYKLKDIG